MDHKAIYIAKMIDIAPTHLLEGASLSDRTGS